LPGVHSLCFSPAFFHRLPAFSFKGSTRFFGSLWPPPVHASCPNRPLFFFFSLESPFGPLLTPFLLFDGISPHPVIPCPLPDFFTFHFGAAVSLTPICFFRLATLPVPTFSSVFFFWTSLVLFPDKPFFYPPLKVFCPPMAGFESPPGFFWIASTLTTFSRVSPHSPVRLCSFEFYYGVLLPGFVHFCWSFDRVCLFRFALPASFPFSSAFLFFFWFLPLPSEFPLLTHLFFSPFFFRSSLPFSGCFRFPTTVVA